MLREGLGFFKFNFFFPDDLCFPRAGNRTPAVSAALAIPKGLD